VRSRPKRTDAAFRERVGSLILIPDTLSDFRLHVRLLLCGLVLGPALAHADWFTVAGVAGDDQEDYIQVDPTRIRFDGERRLLDVRVSRTKTRISMDGVVFRSFQGVAEVDCAQSTARYVSATFYAAPHFAGPPVTSIEYSEASRRPMAFRDISGGFAARLIRAACVVQQQALSDPARSTPSRESSDMEQRQPLDE
jgi:hypothetical protein